MGKKSIIGGNDVKAIANIKADVESTHKTNTNFWDTIGSDVLGVNALSSYGGFMTESSLHLLGDVTNKKILELGCGNGHSLEYVSDIGADELWGLDISPNQIKRTKEYLQSNGINANLVCAPMEQECGIPENYFDVVYAVYAIGWTTDLDLTFKRIYHYLKKDGVFIFSWSHPIHKCVSVENNKLIFCNSYFDESWYYTDLESKRIMLSNRKLSTYINSLAKNGFLIEKLIEDNDKELISNSDNDDFSEKAKMLPVTFVIKARKVL